MVVKAKGGRGGLICTDCGHRADPLQHGDRMRRAWFGALALLAIALVGWLATLAMYGRYKRRIAYWL
jgi:ABC-type polysaccharide/polyol phosphate export permease